MPLPFRIRLAPTRATSHNASRLEDGTHAGSPKLSPDGRLFALGTRTLADLIAPAGAEIRRDHLQLDAQYLRVIVVTGYLRTVAAGWLAPLVEEIDLPLELSLHVRPLSSGDMVRALGLQIAKLESSRRVDLLAQRINDPEHDIALEDADRLRGSLQRGDERVFSVSLYLLHVLAVDQIAQWPDHALALLLALLVGRPRTVTPRHQARVRKPHANQCTPFARVRPSISEISLTDVSIPWGGVRRLDRAQAREHIHIEGKPYMSANITFVSGLSSTTSSSTPVQRGISWSRYTLVGLATVLSAVLANTLLYYIGSALVGYDPDFIVLASPAGAMIFTFVPAVVAVLLYAGLLRLTRRAAGIFSVIAAIVFVVTLIPDLTYIPTVDGSSPAQTAVLMVMHAIAAAVIVRMLTGSAYLRTR